MTTPTVGFAGMTHLAINSLAAMAARGFPVIGYDPDAAKTSELAAGRLPFSEPDLPEYFAENASRMRFSHEAEDLTECDVVYVAPDVPTDDLGRSDLTPIHAMIDIADAAMRPDAIMVVLSQVPPGFTRRLSREKSTLYYQVETLIFGRAVERAMHPERYIVGCDEPSSPLPAPFKAVLEAYGCPILPMRYESAELCKISINMFLVSTVTTTNTIAELCERIGADFSEIAPALRLDRRIGPHAYLSPGLGVSGGNLERDLFTFCSFADEYGADAATVRAWIANSRHRKAWPVRVLEERLSDSPDEMAIGLLGLAYKENTSSTKNSPALLALAGLRRHVVTAYDPAVPDDIELPENVRRAPSAIEAAQGADAVMILTPWPDFRALPIDTLAQAMAGDTVIDPYGVLDAADCKAYGLRQITLGRSATN